MAMAVGLITAVLAVLVYQAIDLTKLPLPCLLPIADVSPDKYSEPASWTGPFAKNNRLQGAVRVFEGQIAGSESVAISRNGDKMYLIDGHGYLKVAHGDPSRPSTLQLEPHLPQTYLGPGRPLGFHLDHDDNLLTCNSILGLTRLRNGSKIQEILANGVGLFNGTISPINYADDLDVAPNGDIYFSDASSIPSAITRTGRYDALRSYFLTALQGSPSGRLLRWNAASGETEVLTEGLWFPNGVALAANASFVVFAETTTARILKYHITGPRAGQTEILIRRLPGYPDGVSRAPDGNFWAALVTEHVPLLDWSARSRFARWALAWLTEFVTVPTKKTGAALKFALDGTILDFVVDPDGSRIGAITSVVEYGGWIYLGSLVNNFVGALELSKA